MADLAVTAANVVGSTQAVRRKEYNFGFAGATAGMIVYLDTAQLWQKVDSNAAVTGNAVTDLVGMTENSGGTGQPAAVIVQDLSGLTTGATMTNGTTVYSSTTAGAFTHDLPTTGAFPRVLGIPKSTTVMIFNPNGTASGVVI